MNTDPKVGLCANCAHARTVSHPRGGDAYVQCARAATDDRYARYPRLPVRACPGYEQKKSPVE